MGTEAARAEVAPALDLGDPEAGISDPVAEYPTVDRNCSDAQIDLNTASAEQIGRHLSIASNSAVQRIIERRPWLSPVDAISVPGVPSSAESRLRALACATPAEAPEPAPLACVSDNALDLQVATPLEISQRLKLPMTTANAIVANRPVPQDLFQIVAPRTPGLSGPKVARLMSDGAVCVTPPPTTFGGTDFRFIYPEHGGVVEASSDDAYALIVPPDTLAEATVAKVTPILDQDLPTSDVHVYGPFDGEVGVRLPDPSQGSPGVFHDGEDGLRVSWGTSATSEPGGTVVSAVASLSQVSATDRGLLCGTSFTYSMNLFCTDTDPRDALLSSLIQSEGARTAGRMNSVSTPNGECAEALSQLVSWGSQPAGMQCSADLETATSSRWQFENTFSTESLAGSIKNFGTVYFVAPTAGAVPISAYSSTPGSANNGPFSGPIARVLADLGIVVPGQARNFIKEAGDGATQVTSTGVNLGVLSLAFGLFNVVEILDEAASLTQFNRAFVVTSCVNQIRLAVNGGLRSAGEAVGCVLSLAEEFLDEAIARLDGQTTLAKNLKVLRGSLSKISPLLLLGQYALAVGSNLAAGSSFNEQSLTFQHMLPPPPPAGSGGSSGMPVPGVPGALDGSIPSGQLTDVVIKLENEGNHAEFTTGGDYLGRAILTTEVYACLTRRFLVRDWLPSDDYLTHIRANSVSPAICDTTVPEFVAPSGSRNFILRKLSGEAHLLGADGRVRPILDSGVYICLAQRYFVLDARTSGDIQSYPQAPIPQVATCP